MNRLAVVVSRATGRRRLALAFLAGAVTPLAMAPFHVWPILLLSLPILAWLLDGVRLREDSSRLRLRRAAAVGWWFGFGYFLTGLYWIGHAFLVDAEQFAWLLPFAVSLMPAGLAIFFALAGALASLLWRRGTARLVGLAAAAMATEWLRAHVFGGFPWITLGYALAGTDAMMQSAALLGIHGLTLAAVLVGASPAAVWGLDKAVAPTRAGRAALPVAMGALLLAGILWGQQRLAGAETAYVPDVRLRVVQPNIPQSEKWRENRQNWVFQTYLDISRQGGAEAAEPLAGVTHLIWPESAVPFLLASTRPALDAIAELLPEGTVFITGAMRTDPEPPEPGFRVYNSLYVMDDAARILATYDKLHLVPFGEYLPFQSFMESIGVAQLTGIRGGFTQGATPRVVEAPGAPPFAALICYEIVFPGAVHGPERRPEWLLNVTNDGWFGVSTGPYQHLHQARVRAVEEGLPVVRAANTGVSAVIDAHGRLLDLLPLGVAGALDASLPRAIPRPVYGRWSGRLEALLLATALLLWLVLGRRSKLRYTG